MTSSQQLPIGASCAAHLSIVFDVLGLYGWCSKRWCLLPGMLMVKLHMLVQRPYFAAQAALATSFVLHHMTCRLEIPHLCLQRSRFQKHIAGEPRILCMERTQLGTLSNSVSRLGSWLHGAIAPSRRLLIGRLVHRLHTVLVGIAAPQMLPFLAGNASVIAARARS